ncbi:hypothetical protein [Azospirillum sp. A23]|uniref:hypothetical protein n=1 Tax=Azospirillum sp. A23 TaxID=3160608 RepID=UPI0036F33E8B
MIILETRLGKKIAVKLADLDWFEEYTRPSEATIGVAIGTDRYEVKRDVEDFRNLLAHAKIETSKVISGDHDHYVIKKNVTHVTKTSSGNSVLCFRSGNRLSISVQFPPEDFTGD